MKRIVRLMGLIASLIIGSLSQAMGRGQAVITTLPKDSLANDTTILNSKADTLSNVVIYGRKWAKISRYSALSMPLSTLDLQTTPAALGDVLGGLQVTPTVQGNDTDGRLVVAGGNPNETQTYVDGLLVMHPNTLGMNNLSVRSRFSPELFQDITLHSGGYNAANGHALSGIIDLKTNTLQKDSKKLTTAINTTGASLSLLLGGHKNQFYVKGSYLDMTPYGLIFKDSYDWKRRYNQQSLDLLYSTQGKSWEVKMQGFASLAGAKYSFSTIDKVKKEQGLNEDFLFYQLTSKLKLPKYWTASLASNVSLWRFEGTDVIQHNDNVMTRDFASHSRLDIQYRGPSSWNIRMGVDNLFQKYRQTYTLGQNYRMSYNSNIFASYADIQYIQSYFTGNVGVRVEYNSLSHKTDFLPRFYFGWKNNDHLLALATGKYLQAPSSDFLKFSSHLRSATAWNSMLTYSFIPNRDKFSASLFYKRYTTLPTYTKNNVLPAFWEYKMDGSGYVYGGNVFIKKGIGLFEAWTSYALTLGKVRSNDQDVAMPLAYAAKHNIKTTLKYWIPKCRILLATSYYWDSGISAIKGISVPSRSRLDLSCSYLPAPKVLIHFSMLNVLGKRNFWGVELSDEDSSRFQYITSPSKCFIYLGCFITLSNNNRHNINPIKI